MFITNGTYLTGIFREKPIATENTENTERDNVLFFILFFSVSSVLSVANAVFFYGF